MMHMIANLKKCKELEKFYRILKISNWILTGIFVKRVVTRTAYLIFNLYFIYLVNDLLFSVFCTSDGTDIKANTSLKRLVCLLRKLG